MQGRPIKFLFFRVFLTVLESSAAVFKLLSIESKPQPKCPRTGGNRPIITCMSPTTKDCRSDWIKGSRTHHSSIGSPPVHPLPWPYMRRMKKDPSNQRVFYLIITAPPRVRVFDLFLILASE